MRALLVGAGGMGRAWLDAVARSPDVELAGVVDLDAGTATAAGAAAGVPAGTDADVLADRVAPDLVLDVTVPAAHHAVTSWALRRGLPVLGEKPLAQTLPEALDLAALAERSGQLFAVSQSRRHSRGLARLRTRVRELGGAGTLAVTFARAPRFGGFRERMAHVLLLDMAIHAFDAARFVLDADPVTVSCEEWNPDWSWYDGAAAAAAVFVMTGGTRFGYSGSWCSPGEQTSWDGWWYAGTPTGSVRWDGVGDPVSEPPADPVRTLPDTTDPPEGIDAALAGFVRALRTGVAPPGAARDNLWSLAMVHAAIASAESGRRVDVAELVARAGAGGGVGSGAGAALGAGEDRP